MTQCCCTLGRGNEFPQDVIEGTGQSNHAWNMAFLNGQWTYIDTTWDSGNKWEFGRISDNSGCYRHKYFMISGDTLSEDHAVLISNSYRELQLYVDYPECWDGAVWHTLNGVAPTVINGTAMVPLRGMIEGMGGTVIYDTECDPSWEKITCKVGKSSFQTTPRVVNDHTLVPLREVLEAMGFTVTWEDYADNWNGQITVGYAV